MKTLNFGFPNHLHLSLHSIVSAPLRLQSLASHMNSLKSLFSSSSLQGLGVLRPLNQN